MTDTPNPNLRISTMTLISGISSNINLLNLYKNLSINDILRFIEFGLHPLKGEKKNKIKNPRKKKIKKFFYNQMTIHILKDKIVNMKIFNNGRIQMTGLKSEEQGYNVIQLFLDEINKLSPTVKETIFDNIEPETIPGRIVLINSDFSFGHKINREVLYRIITEKGYYSSYEPCSYPGVNIKYYYNVRNQNDGICNCLCECNGKGGSNCKSITIAVFNSGNIIITGGQSYKHLTIAYDFICKILNENKNDILIK